MPELAMRFWLTVLISFTTWQWCLAEPVDDQLKKILIADNTAITEIAGLIEKNKAALRNSASERDRLAFRIRERLDQVRQQYEQFLKAHPKHVKARVAYGSFLTHIDDQKAALGQWKLALETDPANAAALNNIATHLGNVALQGGIHSRIPEALDALKKAIALSPQEALYRHNYATTLCNFKLAACRHLKLKPRQVTEMALLQLKTGMELDSKNFEIAADRAETFLDLKPLPRQATLAAWREARKRAKSAGQRDWVNLHESIVHLETGDLDSAEKTLALISKGNHVTLTARLRKALALKRKQATTPTAPKAP